MKPRILINIHYLELGGAESSCIGLLQSLDPLKVDVDLFINDPRGELLNSIPQYVNVLPSIGAYTMLERPIVELIKKGYWHIAIARMYGKWMTKRDKRNNNRHLDNSSGLQWQTKYTTPLLPRINPSVEYDLAIGFVTPHQIVVDKVRAKKKMGWIHTDYTNVYVNVKEELKVWSKLDFIVSISDEVGRKFVSVFPTLGEKIIPIENILSPSFIRSRSEEFIPDDMVRNENVINVLSIGRYSNAKRFDEVGTICRKVREYLSQMCYSKYIHWYIIGYGGDEHLIRQNIAEESMDKWVTILGKRSNPYPYIKACDIYAQPSRYEGKSITVREAQILCKPVVVTNYPTAQSQIMDGVDGIIVPNELDECARGIAVFVADSNKQKELIAYLKEHDYGNENEVNKIYQLLR